METERLEGTLTQRLVDFGIGTSIRQLWKQEVSVTVEAMADEIERLKAENEGKMTDRFTAMSNMLIAKDTEIERLQHAMEVAVKTLHEHLTGGE